MSIFNKKSEAKTETKKVNAGMELSGTEVKSVRGGGLKLAGAFVKIKDGAAWLVNAHISRYTKAGKLDDYDPEQTRKLLLHNRELERIAGKQNHGDMAALFNRQQALVEHVVYNETAADEKVIHLSSNCQFHAVRTDGELFWAMKHGVPESGMVSYIPHQISEEEGWQVVAYLRTFCEFA